MEKDLLIKDIVFVGSNWDNSKKKAECVCKVEELIPQFPNCETCKTNHEGKDLFWVIEELKQGFIIKRYQSNVFSVCSIKCLMDRGLQKNAYYSIVGKLASGEVISTGFQGRNAVAINDFAKMIVN